ncbi:MAG: ribonuclease Y [Clostridia bacterium]|nr:ribonuclease Y [Clostridia bacterium]
MEPVVLGIVVGLISLIIGAVGGIAISKAIDKKNTAIAKSKAAKIIEDAYSEAKAVRKESVLEAKEEAHKIKQELDSEIKERRTEIQKLEERLIIKEENLIKKEEMLDKKQENLEVTKNALLQKENELQVKEGNLIEEQNKCDLELSRVAKLTIEEAKAELIQKYEIEAKQDAVKYVREIEQQAKDEADKKSKEIITMAIQKCAVDHAQDITVSAVAIPNEEIKGRIIGREGRNIRALEQATGVELIIDDTPDVITLSSFDPVRREIARIALEKLILDGRIHPTRIEELVEKAKKDVDLSIREAGENALYDSGIHNMHPELARILGRLKFRTSYGQNCLNHSLEVCHLAGLMASEIGADVNTAKRGGLLHDIGKAVDFEQEGTHVSLGVEIAKKYKESPAVIHCIEAHHFGVEFQSVEAILVQVADAISSARPGARRESLESYIKRLENLENIAKSFDGVDKTFAIQAGREIRVIVKPDEVSDEKAYFLAKDIAKKIENELQYPGQIKVNVIREIRKTEIAK